MTQKLSKNAKKVWRTRATLVFLVVSFVCGGVYVFSPMISLIIEAVNLTAYLFVILAAVPYVYHVTTLEVRKDGLTITKGVIMKKRMNILAKKIQYVELIQTPVQRFFKVYTVAFHTAGATVFVSQVDSDMGYHFRAYKE
ncbi:MAG: PH domain-containing protein [Ruminococcus sp.]